MTLAGIYAFLKAIGGAAGLILTLVTFFGVVSKRPRMAFRRIIREEADNANKDLKESIANL